MKQILKITFVYIGLIIGAGFASGREILEYFNIASSTNFSGILIATALFVFIAYIILSKSAEQNIGDFNSYIESVSGKMAPFVKWFMLIYMFCGLFVMFSGSGALIDSITPLPPICGAVFMALICFMVLSFDLKGIVTLNMILVPLMICGIIYVTVSSVFASTDVFLGEKTAEITLSAVCYSVYNTVTAGAVLVPLAKDTSIKQIRISAILGGFIIGLLIFLVWTVIGLNLDNLLDSPLPMLELAAFCGKNAKKVYSLVLFMAICTTAVSYGFGLMSRFSVRKIRDRVTIAGILCLSALPFSMYGFSTLVSQLYSAFGYIGMIWIVMIIIDRYC